MDMKLALRTGISDRTFVVTVGLLWLIVAVLLVIGAVHIRASELRVPTHFTHYGVTHYYNDRWYYLLNFMVFGAVSGVLHTLIAAKLLLVKGREIALCYLWLSIAAMVIVTTYIVGLLNVVQLAQ